MATIISFDIKYKKNTGMVISVSELQSLYLYGINVRSKDGSQMSDDMMKTHILSAQKEIERYLSIKFQPTLIEEKLSYYRTDYMGGFPIFPTKYPVHEGYTLIGLINNISQVVYPREWISTANDPDQQNPRLISLVPTGSSNVTGDVNVILTGVMTQLGLQRHRNIPNYWTVQYRTGFDVTPIELLDLVGKFAAIKVLTILGDLVFGNPGVSNMSLSIDGLSQSTGTVNGAKNSAFGGRITQYSSEISTTLKRLKMQYKGFNMASL